MEVAVDRGVDPDVVEELRKKPPGFAQQWAEDNGLAQQGSRKGVRIAGDAPPANAPIGRKAGKPAAAHARRGRAVGGGGAAAPLGRQPKAGPQESAFQRRLITDPRIPDEMGDETRAAVGNMMAVQGGHPQEIELLNRLPVVSNPVAAGVNGTNRITFHDGSVGYHKPFSDLENRCARSYGQEEALQPVHEAAAWQMAKRMGPEYETLVPPCVLRHVDGKLGSLAQGVGSDSRSSLASVDPKSRNNAAFFDALIANQDRHGGNYLIEGNTLHLIDHGFSFATPGDYANANNLVRYREQSGGSDLTKKERGLAKNLAKSPDLWGMDKLLTPDRAQALRARAETMARTGRLLKNGEF